MLESLNQMIWCNCLILHASCIIKWKKMNMYKLNALFKRKTKKAFHLRKGLQQRQIWKYNPPTCTQQYVCKCLRMSNAYISMHVCLRVPPTVPLNVTCRGMKCFRRLPVAMGTWRSAWRAHSCLLWGIRVTNERARERVRRRREREERQGANFKHSY